MEGRGAGLDVDTGVSDGPGVPRGSQTSISAQETPILSHEASIRNIICVSLALAVKHLLYLCSLSHVRRRHTVSHSH